MSVTLKIALLGPNLDKNRASIGHDQNQVHFFSGKTKGDNKLFRNFLFYQNIISFD